MESRKSSDRSEKISAQPRLHQRAAQIQQYGTRDFVKHAKPDPDLFLAAAEHLKFDIHNCIVVGDSIWDLLAAQRARALGGGNAAAYGDLGEARRTDG